MTTKFLTERITESRTSTTGRATGNSRLCQDAKARANQGNQRGAKNMHKRAEYSGILVSLDTLTLGKQQQWLDSQPEQKKQSEIQERKRVRRLIKLAKDEEKE